MMRDLKCIDDDFIINEKGSFKIKANKVFTPLLIEKFI